MRASSTESAGGWPVRDTIQLSARSRASSIRARSTTVRTSAQTSAETATAASAVPDSRPAAEAAAAAASGSR